MTKTIEEILPPKPEARLRVYAYSIDDDAHRGLLKVGQTTRDVKQRVAEQLKTAAIKNYRIELDEPADRADGSSFTDHEVRGALVKKGFDNPELEWMRCTVADVLTVLTELRAGQRLTGTHHETFPLRREQVEAVAKTHAYFHSIWKENIHAVPRFLWNAKMRFGKTFTTYQHKSDVQKWLDILRGGYAPQSIEHLKTGTRPPFPYSDVRLLPYLQHAFWFLPNVAACHAMANLLAERHNTFWHAYRVIVAAGTAAGIDLEALPPVRRAIGSGFDTQTITLSCGKLTTGVTVPQWSSILMLRNLQSPETYFQAAFRVQSPWSIKNPNGDNPHAEEILKPVCFVFDFAPTRALRQLSEYSIGLAPNEPNPENRVRR